MAEPTEVTLTTLRKLAVAGLAAVTLATATTASTTPASAQWCRWHYCGGYYRQWGWWGPGAILGGLAAGAIVGSAVAAHNAACWRIPRSARVSRAILQKA